MRIDIAKQFATTRPRGPIYSCKTRDTTTLNTEVICEVGRMRVSAEDSNT